MKDAFEVGDGREVAAGVGQIQSDAAVAGAFGDADVGGSGGAEGFERGVH